ncbi:hypothetical protein [Streptomyces sp. NPDC058548]|uniref:hypothetical protein n=1 Tax=Streptomyces sp. NPDC058548 TaxID=3346545 RepID=UPI00364D2924
MSKSSPSNAMTATFRAARDGARAAANTAAHVAGLYLIEANGGRGAIRETWRGEGPVDAWCQMAAPGVNVYLLADAFGDRAHVTLRVLAPAEYERIRAWFTERDECPHDEECDCCREAWPILAGLAGGAEQDVMARDGELRGWVHEDASTITLALMDEPVELVADLLGTLRTG